eukprot:scaffold179431_cov31-Prasinocladus_malaysianus.AAC.1
MESLPRGVHSRASAPKPSSQLTMDVGIAAMFYKYVEHGATSDTVGRPPVLLNNVYGRSPCCTSQLKWWWGCLRYLMKSCEPCSKNVLQSRRCIAIKSVNKAKTAHGKSNTAQSLLSSRDTKGNK